MMISTGLRGIRKSLLLLLGLTLILPSAYYLKGLGLRGGEGPAQDLSQGFTVTKVIDGDTIELSNGEIVRYIGIDAPELRHKVGGVWVETSTPLAKEATEFNERLVGGKRVRLAYDLEMRDRYHRLLAYVYVGDLFVNAEMVREGYAVAHTYLPNTRYADLFSRLEREAKDQKKGIWSAVGALRKVFDFSGTLR